MKNILYVCVGIALALGVNYAIAQVEESLPVEQVQQISPGRVIANKEFQLVDLHTKNETTYTIDELQLMELQKINNHLLNIENSLWRKN